MNMNNDSRQCIYSNDDNESESCTGMADVISHEKYLYSRLFFLFWQWSYSDSKQFVDGGEDSERINCSGVADEISHEKYLCLGSS